MSAKYDNVLWQNENQRAQIKLPMNTIGELRNTVKSLQSMLARIFAAINEGQFTAALTKPTEALDKFPSARAM